MGSKRKKNTFVVQLSPSERLSLWIVLDLLHFVRTGSLPQIDFPTVRKMWNVFDSLDGYSEAMDIAFSAREHRICCISLTYACRYLDEEYIPFDMPILPKIAQELTENAFTIRRLYHLFAGGNP